MDKAQSLLIEHARIWKEVKRLQEELDPFRSYLKFIESEITKDIRNDFTYLIQYDHSVPGGKLMVLESK